MCRDVLRRGEDDLAITGEKVSAVHYVDDLHLRDETADRGRSPEEAVNSGDESLLGVLLDVSVTAAEGDVDLKVFHVSPWLVGR